MTGTGLTGSVRLAGAVITDGTRVLLGLRGRDRASHPHVWDVPGGHVRPHESPRQALHRELGEELGIDAEVGPRWRLVTDVESGTELSLWVIRRWLGVIHNAAPHEHQRLSWFGPDELDALAVPHPSYPAMLRDALGRDDP